MGNDVNPEGGGKHKKLDVIAYKTALNESISRMNIKRGKLINEHTKARQKIVEFVINGDLSSALIYIENYINDEGKIKVYDVLSTMCD